ncbi:MAG: endonuclease MutS2, partial [Anaerolineae bacterium]|nr:endonuclease MutS2 [Thermoflexales bacterium]MDW8407724.1 endonuclease MutS2 [Anaerolineae bacterium]
LSIGGARDVRELAQFAVRGGVLEPADLLAIRDTLISARTVQRTLSRFTALYPQLTAITNPIEPCGGLANEISRCLDEKAELRDSASPELANIRREARAVYDRLMQKLQRLINDVAHLPWLQEPIITQRSGRYVIPVKADHKGRIPGLIHDQSASGQTVFVEPLVTLELNNRWRELQLAEAREVRRVLTNLSALVGQEAPFIKRTVEALAQFDLALAKAKYAEAVRGVEAGVSVARIIDLRRARHPLLKPDTVVPIDVLMNDQSRVLVITGPNTGGKTVALKTIGLLAAMNQCGLHIPAESATLPIFKRLYADIGDEQSIEQSLSTFSAHLTNLVSFLGSVDAHSLVLLDELGAGTDPVEGAALARAILEHLLNTGAFCVVATHYPNLKAWAYITDGAQNASVAFDDETLQPLYRLQIGLPGRSNAFVIAQRLGLPAEVLLQAQSYIDAGDARTEDMLAEIARLQRQTEAARQAAARAKREAEEHADKIRARLANIEDERQALLAEARAEVSREIDALRAEVRRLRSRVLAAGGALDEVKTLERETERLEEQAERSTAHESRKADPARLQRQRPLRVNDRVHVRSLNAEGVINAIVGDEADVQVGRLRTRAKLSDLERVRTASAHESAFQQEVYESFERPASPGMELDLRGLTSDEGLSRLEQYLERAARASLPYVRIIHGKGTGALRRAIRNAIKDNPLVRSFEAGQESEGGDGVTVVKLVEM